MHFKLTEREIWATERLCEMLPASETLGIVLAALDRGLKLYAGIEPRDDVARDAEELLRDAQRYRRMRAHLTASCRCAVRWAGSLTRTYWTA